MEEPNITTYRIDNTTETFIELILTRHDAAVIMSALVDFLESADQTTVLSRAVSVVD